MPLFKTVFDKVLGKHTFENPDWPLYKVYQDIDWVKSGGTKTASIIATGFIFALNAKTIIEIGLWQGFTTQILGKALSASAMNQGLLISCDITQRAINHSKEYTKDLPINHITICEDSFTIDFNNYLEGRKAELIFIDGNHSYEYVKKDIWNCSNFLSNNGVMIVHDYSKNANHIGVIQAVNEFVIENGWQMIFIPENRESTDYRSVILQKMKYK